MITNYLKEIKDDYSYIYNNWNTGSNREKCVRPCVRQLGNIAMVAGLIFTALTLRNVRPFPKDTLAKSTLTITILATSILTFIIGRDAYVLGHHMPENDSEPGLWLLDKLITRYNKT